MRITGAWLHARPLGQVFAGVEAAGHRIWLVGGAVRNAVLGQPVEDLDLASDATPDQMMALARVAGLKPVPTGIEHGTVTIIADGVPHEVTTLRRDVKTDGRHAQVAFTDDILEDARRRDFTMNALYADATGLVIDPLGGLADTLAGRVRFIEDADRRIREDYLRILRFFRFYARYGGEDGIDAEGLAAVARNLDGLAGLARERVTAELLKLLCAPDPAPALASMRQAGVLLRVLPGGDDMALAPLVHLEGLYAVPPEPIRRLATLGGDAESGLRLSKAQAKRLALLQALVGETEGPDVLGYRYGPEVGRDALLLRAALMQAPLPSDSFERLHQGAVARFPLVAADLMPAYKGAALGARLRVLEARWIESGFAATRDALLKADL